MASFSQSLYILALLIILALWNSRVTLSHKLVELEACSPERHEQWMVEHGKYYKDVAEKEKRYQIFKENVEFIESFNANNNKNLTFKLGVNQFADQTFEEFKTSSLNGKKDSLGLLGMEEIETPFRYENATDIPETMDWRKRGAVTPIKDQKSCGSCWAFATVAIVEGIHQITTGKLESLSEQELVDCVRGNTDGCNGGYMEDAFKFIAKKGGIASEATYPYKNVNRTCNSKKEPVASINGYEKVPKNNEKALLKAVANQPVGVYIEAGQKAFQFYSGGIFAGKCGTKRNHVVALVGYGSTEDGTKYWIVKNSWGKNWGENGYMRMKRDIKSKKGLCGLAMEPRYPVA